MKVIKLKYDLFSISTALATKGNNKERFYHTLRNEKGKVIVS